MLKRIFIFCFALITFSFSPNTVFAASDFATSYKVNYSIDEGGVATVTEDIVLRNLTDRLYASTFSITIGASDVFEVEARDKQGVLKHSITHLDKKTQIKVDFTQQVVGKGKEYPWTLRFKSKDFAQKIGNSWQVSVPKIASLENLESFDLSLSVPVSFGDPSSLQPEPVRQNETGGNLNFFFTKDQLTQSGIFAAFGSDQTLSFDLIYKLNNDGILPKVVSIALPSNTSYQEVIFNKIDPRPENVVIDEDGNYIGYFRLTQRQNLEVRVEGLSKLYLENLENLPPLSDGKRKTYLSGSSIWTVESPAIRTKAKELIPNPQIKVSEKAKILHKFTANVLKFDFKRFSEKNTNQLDSLTVLNNPNQSLASEYANLFVALSRAAGVPARKVVGYAYTENEDIRPLSYTTGVLHTWAEYYDNEKGWIMVDPAWESTTGGVEYFPVRDISHFVIETVGGEAKEYILPSELKVAFNQAEFNKKNDVELTLNIQDEIFAGFPADLAVRIENNGNTASNTNSFSLSTAKLKIEKDEKDNCCPQTSFTTPIIPPFGHLNYAYVLKTNSIWDSYEDILQLRFGERNIEKKVLVKPFFAYKYFSFAVIVTIFVMALSYILVLTLFLKVHKSVPAAIVPGREESKPKVSKQSLRSKDLKKEKAKAAIKKATRVFKKKKSTKTSKK